MAMVKTDGTVTSIEGKFGGVVYREDTCGQHVQAAPAHREQRFSEEHMKVLDCFHTVSDYFGKYYDDYEHVFPKPQFTIDEVVDRWKLYASHYPRKTKKGRTYYLSWYQMYMSYNMNLCLAGQPLTLVPLPDD